jgi:hypothetical protein
VPHDQPSNRCLAKHSVLQHIALEAALTSNVGLKCTPANSRRRHHSKRVREAVCCTHNALLLYTQAKCHKATGSNAATRPEKVKHTRKPTPCKHRAHQSAQGHFFHTRIKNNRKTQLHTDTPPIGRQQEQSLSGQKHNHDANMQDESNAPHQPPIHVQLEALWQEAHQQNYMTTLAHRNMTGAPGPRCSSCATLIACMCAARQWAHHSVDHIRPTMQDESSASHKPPIGVQLAASQPMSTPTKSSRGVPAHPVDSAERSEPAVATRGTLQQMCRPLACVCASRQWAHHSVGHIWQLRALDVLC